MKKNDESAMPDDSFSVTLEPHPFKFSKSRDKEITELVVTAIDKMGDNSKHAESLYQESLSKLRENSTRAVPVIISEYYDLPEIKYLDRWSLIQLLTDLKQPSVIKDLDKIISSQIPPERSENPNYFSTRGEEIIIRTTAIEGIRKLATDDNKDAIEILLKHTRSETFSIKRAAIQSYIQVGGEIAKKRLIESLPKEDHYILSIKQTDVQHVPQPTITEFAKPSEIDDSPKKTSPKLIDEKPDSKGGIDQ
jgi:hypothetical protein